MAVLLWAAGGVLIPFIWWRVRKPVAAQIQNQREKASSSEFDAAWRQDELVWNVVTVIAAGLELAVLFNFGLAVAAL
jgi:hypothetical protein